MQRNGGLCFMNYSEKKIKVVYSSTNEKDLKDVVLSLIRTHENKCWYDKKMNNRQAVV